VKLCARAFALVAIALAAHVAQAESEEPDEEIAALRLGVTPFLSAGPAGAVALDVASALADELATRGLARVAGPALFTLETEPGASEARDLAGRAGVDALVVGRTTRLGSRLSVDVRLRSARTGGVMGAYVAEVPTEDALAAAVSSLADQLILGALALGDGHPDAVPLATRRRTAPRGGDGVVPRAVTPLAAPSAPPFGFGDLEGEPLSIRSGTLDAREEEGARTVTFRDDVRVTQGDLTLRADVLEAAYAAGEKQPRRLHAKGGVHVSQGEREARCREAVYRAHADEIVCRGAGRLRDGEDVIEGEEITFDLARRTVAVEGATNLTLHPEAEGPGPGDALGEGHDASQPIAVRADRLHAAEADAQGLHRLVLEGGVEVVQSGVTLRSERLDVLYPDGARAPERLEASGDVSLVQGVRNALCDVAVYRAHPERIECRLATLNDGEDRVEGDLITFDLVEDRVSVEGGARLVLAPRPEGATQ
jgi:lipopolysaccharide transport protein LptA